MIGDTVVNDRHTSIRRRGRSRLRRACRLQLDAAFDGAPTDPDTDIVVSGRRGFPTCKR